MRQEINLYNIEFRRGEQPLSSRTVLRAAAVFFAVLMLIEGLTAWQLMDAKGNLVELEGDQQILASRLDDLRKSQPFSEREQIESQVDDLREQIARRKELQSIISGQELGNAHGFSGFMEAMARQSGGDLSLTRIRLLNGGDYLELNGHSRTPQAVPQYLHKLRGENIFHAVKFGTLVIERNDEGRLQFRLGKSEEGSS